MKNIYLIVLLSLVLNVFATAQNRQECAYSCTPANMQPFQITALKLTNRKVSNCLGIVNTPNFLHYIGSMHQHSGFSDGFRFAVPRDYYRRAKDSSNMKFTAGSEHSDTYNVPITLRNNCLSNILLECLTVGVNNPDYFDKWNATQEQKNEFTENGRFVGIRGFEWTSERFGHINVYFTQNITNAKADGGHVQLATFYQWLATEPTLLTLNGVTGGFGGADGFAVFNHPGEADLGEQDPALNWTNFEYSATADPFMAGMEVFNDIKDYPTESGKAYFQTALDKGWHLGAFGTEDQHSPEWSNPRQAKTVFIANELTENGLKDAVKNRRLYALRGDYDLRMTFDADNASPMGSRIQNRLIGSTVQLSTTVNSAFAAKIEIISNGNTVVASVDNNCTLNFAAPVTATEKWYFVRVADAANKTIAYSSPIWVKGSATVLPLEWLSFTAKSNQKNMEVLLNWAVENEKDNQFFEIQRSENGRNFEIVGRVENRGNGTYSFVDNAPTFGIFYYRIRQVDRDGKESFSNFQLVQLGTSELQVVNLQGDISAKNALITLFSPTSQMIDVQVFDLNGRQILSEKRDLTQGNNFITLHYLASGMNFIRLVDSKNKISITKKIVL